METNFVDITGFVKRDSFAQSTRSGSLMDLTLVTSNPEGNNVYVDCFLKDDACQQVGGSVEAGERLRLVGHLSWRTWVNSVGTRTTRTCVVVEEVIFEGEGND